MRNAKPPMLFVLVLSCLLGSIVARDNGLGAKPVMGWNTWCTQNSCGVDWCTSKEILNVAQTIQDEGLQAIGYDHINLDDCWGVRNNVTHKIEGDPTRFPEGMPAFIAKLHKLGFKFGLYTDIGEHACHHPFTGSWPYYQQDADTFASWKVDYVKFDGCDKPAAGSAEQLTGNFSHALNKTGRAMWLNFHCWHTETCAQYGNSYRVNMDHHDQWANTAQVIQGLQTKREPFWGPDPAWGWPDPDFIYPGGQGCGAHSAAGQRCPGQTDNEYLSEMSIWSIGGGQVIFATDPRNMSAIQKKILFNTEIIEVFRDADSFRNVVVTSGNCTDTPTHPTTPTHVGVGVCDVTLKSKISGSPCTPNIDFGCVNSDSMWTDHGCRGEFLCHGFNVVCSSNGFKNDTCKCQAQPAVCQRWIRPLSDGKRVAVVLHNEADVESDVKFDFSTVPGMHWGSGTSLQVRDLWEHSSSTATGHITARVGPHGSGFFILSEK